MLIRLGQIGFRLWRARRGVTAVEFGFVCVPLIGIMIATMQVATTYFSQQALETAAEKGARLLLTGQAQNAGMSAAAFKSAVCGALPTYMTCDNLLIDVDVADDFSAEPAKFALTASLTRWPVRENVRSVRWLDFRARSRSTLSGIWGRMLTIIFG